MKLFIQARKFREKQ